VSISTNCAAAMSWSPRSEAARAPSWMEWNFRVSWLISSGIATVAASTCSGSKDESAFMEGSIICCTRFMSMNSRSTS
jgi:hypothetical protein